MNLGVKVFTGFTVVFKASGGPFILKLIPKSPYAVGKVFAHEMTKVYRESYDIFGVNGILFNHEFQAEFLILSFFHFYPSFNNFYVC